MKASKENCKRGDKFRLPIVAFFRNSKTKSIAMNKGKYFPLILKGACNCRTSVQSQYLRCHNPTYWPLSQLAYCTFADRLYSPPTSLLIMIEQSDDEVPVMLKLWGMLSTTSLPSLQSPLSDSTWQGPINESNRTKLCTYVKLNCLK